MILSRFITKVSLELLKFCVLLTNISNYLPKRKNRKGRKEFSPLSLFLSLLLKVRQNFEYDMVLVRKLGENTTYQQFCGFKCNTIPSHDTLSRFMKNITLRRLKNLILKLDIYLADQRLFNQDDLPLDTTDIPSNGRNRHNPDPQSDLGYKTDK
jgi:hypothetical protein